MKFLKQFFTLFIFFSATLSASGQKIAKGRIVDENFQIIPYAVININDTTKLGEANVKGYFEVSIPKGEKILTFRGVAYEPAIISITDDCEYLEVVLLRSGTYDFMSSKKVDRLRKKRFDKLPFIYSEAFQKGIFKNEKPCFNQEFIPYKKRLDEIAKKVKIVTRQNKIDFKKLAIGDTIQIPFSSQYNYDGTDRTTLFNYSYLIQKPKFDCLIDGIILNKTTNKEGYFLTFKVNQVITNKIKPLIYNNKEIVVGQTVAYNMKYFKVIIQ